MRSLLCQRCPTAQFYGACSRDSEKVLVDLPRQNVGFLQGRKPSCLTRHSVLFFVPAHSAGILSRNMRSALHHNRKASTTFKCLPFSKNTVGDTGAFALAELLIAPLGTAMCVRSGRFKPFFLLTITSTPSFTLCFLFADRLLLNVSLLELITVGQCAGAGERQGG